jgi:hypothetical protein
MAGCFVGWIGVAQWSLAAAKGISQGWIYSSWRTYSQRLASIAKIGGLSAASTCASPHKMFCLKPQARVELRQSAQFSLEDKPEPIGVGGRW